MRCLITGATGFAGRHLTERLQADGHEVFGTTRQAPHAPEARSAIPLLPPDRLLAVDVTDRHALTSLVRRLQPDGLFHLAAITSVAASFNDPEAVYRTNLFGSLNVFAAVHEAAAACRIVWVGSSDAYGQMPVDELPVVETHLFRPLSPYAVSKAAADLAAFQWSRAHGLDVIRLRAFNHTGPGQAAQFVCSDFARQLIEVERSTRPAQVHVGNLDAVRDFSDVRDVVRAYALAWQTGTAGEAYNVCSGTGRTVREILDTLIRLSGIGAAAVAQPQRRRPVDVPVLIGSAAKLRRATGWVPTIAWEQTLGDLLQDWRLRLA